MRPAIKALRKRPTRGERQPHRAETRPDQRGGRGVQEHLVRRYGVDVVVLHQLHEVVARDPLDGHPEDGDDGRDHEQVQAHQFPHQGETPEAR
jgi:hypothetical protein